MKTEIKNLTPHAVTLMTDTGNIVTIQPSGIVARVAVKRETVGSLPAIGVPITRAVFGDPVGVPEPQEGVYLIVSAMVRNALPDRTDLLSPGDLVRDDSGRVIACSNLDTN